MYCNFSNTEVDCIYLVDCKSREKWRIRVKSQMLARKYLRQYMIDASIMIAWAFSCYREILKSLSGSLYNILD